MKISFDSRLYSRAAIESSIAEYQDFARFEVGQEGQNFVVQIEQADDEVKDVIADEFSNFVLARMQG